MCMFIVLQGADYVIALTHMRTPNDTRLAENVKEIDLILGGHDHDYVITQVQQIFYLNYMILKRKNFLSK